jgi:hypothetical protein
MPLLPNGKIDRKRLTAEAARHAPAETAAQEPNERERQLLAIVSDILSHDDIGIHDDFFAIGGTSLLGMRYLARTGAAFGVDLGARDLMRAPTVSGMARLIADRAATSPPIRDRLRLGPSAAAMWRPLALARAEGQFERIDAAAIAYLPDDLA